MRSLTLAKRPMPSNHRVAATPDTVKRLKGLGLDIVVETGAGGGASIPDQAFADAGATIAPDEAAALADADRVFKGYRDDAPADIDRPWREVRAAAGLVGVKHCRFHDLRHTTASYLTMNGATLAEVAEGLGHRTLVMAKRYSHQSGERGGSHSNQ